MPTILIIGAGKSSTYLIQYLLDTLQPKSRKLLLADLNLETAREKLAGYADAEAVALDLQDASARKQLIQRADVVISMLPAAMHPLVAKDCLAFGRHFFTASYESAEMREWKSTIEEKKLFWLNEMGLDPGLDHLSAMKIIDEARAEGNEIIGFKSFCGGLICPESPQNPWKYKFTWNPRNVVLAGQGTSRFIRNGRLKYVPYHMLFRRTEPVHIPGAGDFEAYPNRDSLSYRKVYGLENIPTLLRGTLRNKGFCRSWDFFVQLGMTDDSFIMDLPEDFTYRQFTNTFLPFHATKTVEEKILELLPFADEALLEQVRWLGLLAHTPMKQRKGSPAMLLQGVLEEKWALGLDDKDMIVMQHQFILQRPDGTRLERLSNLVVKGETQERTAMAKTVGLPLAIAVDLFLDGKIPLIGLHIPVQKEIYLPVLEKIAQAGITFQETTRLLEPAAP
ncbi:saccharopine dehydrogenase-like oxidoreductase [Nitritalea halalkaliphila LW7]|uniref:Saccharopine dehydrogenase-like oxidoreductase n=1 Tax=Nitritalea halalkaliphila LW7 TaxID=1189621 RepID=I5BZ01_9BACT|nr:saccharopine dehydrogenase C-terminal domain-containing protein [Nitritalea halalkaliphila]EIM74803.1 saccharopine dehydrogenase-like oxidoreductase [Nitritalea halalkaliphila LW7]